MNGCLPPLPDSLLRLHPPLTPLTPPTGRHYESNMAALKLGAEGGKTMKNVSFAVFALGNRAYKARG